MKVQINKFAKKHKISVTGDENWLETIYNYFPAPKNSEKPKVNAEMEFEKVNDEFLRVNGNLSYTPFVDCSRCGIKIPWLISEQFDLYYQLHREDFGDEEVVDVQTEELDEYYLDNGELDIEQLINERIQLAIPTRILLRKKDKADECAVCEESLDDSKVYGVSKEEDPTNPFAALKNMKIKN